MRKTIKVILIVLFALLSIGSLLASIYWIWLTLFGIGWGGGDATLLEVVWMWKGIVLISIYSAIASIGLIKLKKIGLIFGFATPIAISLYLLTTIIMSLIYELTNEIEINFADLIEWIFGLTLIIGIPTLLIIGLNRLWKENVKFKTIDGIASVVLTLLLFLSLHFMF